LVCGLSSSPSPTATGAHCSAMTKAVALRSGCSPSSKCRDILDLTSGSSDVQLLEVSTSLLPVARDTNPALCIVPYSARAVPAAPCDQRHLKAPRVDIIMALEVCGSLLGLVCGQIISRSSRQPPNVPDVLHPTPLQLTTPHYSWIDRLPFPRMRDNLILLAHTINLEELLQDFFDMETFTVNAGSLPWDPTAWRMSPEFRAKWGYLFH